jgi:hypothetical protein
MDGVSLLYVVLGLFSANIQMGKCVSEGREPFSTFVAGLSCAAIAVKL